MPHTCKTSLYFSLSDSLDAAQHRLDLTLRYTVYKGHPATLEDPGSGPSVNILSAFIRHDDCGRPAEHNAPTWLWSFLESDTELEAELLAHAAADEEYAREQAADARRDEARLS